MIDMQNPEVAFALEVTQRAALLIKLIQDKTVTSTLTKDDRSPVTAADFASQALVAATLLQTFPHDPLIAEEGAATLRKPESIHILEQITSFVKEMLPEATPGKICAWIEHGTTESASRFWTLDPIDGTKGFLRGDQYAVALALVVNGKVQVAALGCPKLNLQLPDTTIGSGNGCLVIAARGQGSYAAPLYEPANLVPIHVSSVGEPGKMRILRSFESGHTNVDKISALAEALGVKAAPLSMDSQAKYAVLAAGGGEVMLRMLSAKQPNYREKIWDQAAGSLILEEAGGKISDLTGAALDFTTGRTLSKNRGILASNGILHCIALEALNKLEI
ncbi:MAG: 3'(2'),5'-bisphosphate nucleotidase [Chloroflexota bacterium]